MNRFVLFLIVVQGQIPYTQPRAFFPTTHGTSSSSHPSSSDFSRRSLSAAFARPHVVVRQDEFDVSRRVSDFVRPSVAIVSPTGVRNTTALGSGFVVPFPNPNGIGVVSFNANDGRTSDDEPLFLLTAAHVAAPGHRVRVRFPERGENNKSPAVDATVIGREMKTDLALLRISRTDLLMGSSSSSENGSEDENVAAKERTTTPPHLSIVQGDVRIGDLSFACGFPAGLITSDGPAMTMGIVCGTAPEFDSTTTEEDQKVAYVVTDAAMAGGMSGGPLVNANGEVIGMNALVRSDLRALGNYAVFAGTIASFLDRLAILFYGDGRSTVVNEDGISFVYYEETTTTGATTTSMSSTTGYRVVLYNDRMNKRKRVSKLLTDNEIVPLNSTEAEKVMLSAHRTGTGVVKEFNVKEKDIAVELTEKLRSGDLMVELERVFDDETKK